MSCRKRHLLFKKSKLYYNRGKSNAHYNLNNTNMAIIDCKTMDGRLVSSIMVPEEDKLKVMQVYGGAYFEGLEGTFGNIIIEERLNKVIANRMDRRGA